MPSEVSVVDPLVTILIPCLGQLEYSKLCVPSVLKWSRHPFELSFLDMGSLDGTAEYIAGVKAAASVRVEHFRTETDLGIKQVCKEALSKARGEYLVLLNNDTLVTHGWLDQMISLAKSKPEVGAVGPMSNYAAAPQGVQNVPYRFGKKSSSGLIEPEAVYSFAREFRDSNKGKWVEAERLGGFCLLLKKELWKKVEFDIDKWTDLSLFDTDILSAKAKLHGYVLGVCRDLFIHHFGTRVFAHSAPEAGRDGKPTWQPVAGR